MPSTRSEPCAEDGFDGEVEPAVPGAQRFDAGLVREVA
jgi:hypothetical protein